MAPQLFLGEQGVNVVMAVAAQVNAPRLHLGLGKAFLEPLVAMARAGDQVMKGEWFVPAA
jgi:hypothetical protein